ncbi:hypothetical protein BYT27DRAFT_7097244, partial [Phlegmacium glaucopus]
GQARARQPRLWLGLRIRKAKATSGQAKAGALWPSQAGTALPASHPLHQQTQILCHSEL